MYGLYVRGKSDLNIEVPYGPIMAMIKPNEDIMEEMYAFLYEVTPVKTEHTLPIYQTYKTNEGQTHLKIVENQFAAFPSDVSLKKWRPPLV